MPAQQYIQDILAANGGTLPTTTGASKAGSAGDTATATNATATITYAAPGAGLYNTISGVWWSLSAAPTTTPVTLTVSDNGVPVYVIDIIVGGAGGFSFGKNLRTSAVNTPITITLTAGGVGIVGRINSRKWTET